MSIRCGSSTHTLHIDDNNCTSCQERTFHLYLPTSLCNATADDYDDSLDSNNPNSTNISTYILPSKDLNVIGIQKLPLVFAVHSLSKTAEIFKYWTEIAQEFNFVLVRPQGYEFSWNAKVCCGGALREDVNDERFFFQIIANLTNQFGFLDANHVSAMGWSNGAFMVSSVAHLFQAVAPISGYPYNTSDYVNIANNIRGDEIDEREGNRSVAWFQHHGYTDHIIAYDGCCLDPKEGEGGSVCPVLGEHAGRICTSAKMAFESWASKVNRCTNVTLLSKNDTLKIECWQGEECASNTTLCSYGRPHGHFVRGAFEDQFPTEMTNEIAHFFARNTCEQNDGEWIREKMICDCSKANMKQIMYCFDPDFEMSEDGLIDLKLHILGNASSLEIISEDDLINLEVDTLVNASSNQYFSSEGISDLTRAQLQPYFMIFVFPLVLLGMHRMRIFSRTRRKNETPDLNLLEIG